MKTSPIFTVLVLLLFSLNLFAHKGGHGHQNTSDWTIDGETVEASFLAMKDGKVVLETKNGETLNVDFESFSLENRMLIARKAERISEINRVQRHTETPATSQNSATAGFSKASTDGKAVDNIYLIGILLAVVLTVIIVLYLVKRRVIMLAVTALLSLSMLGVTACSDDDSVDDEDTEEVTDDDTDEDSGDETDGDTDDDTDEVSTVPPNDVAALEALFANFPDVTTSSDDTYFYVSSTGIPEHEMMTGISNWQQQVPIPQDYTGDNSWAFPIQPVLAETPLASSEHFLRGAFAIAVNGIPIFNPLNNRGEDALSIGELDNWGGHCGRADDYHYHVPPTHLDSIVGEDQPVGYAFDGFPIYGETTDELDEYLGKFNDDGSYQYHTTDTSPYFMAGMRGEVTLDPSTTAPEDQILPQAMTQEVRPALMPLEGAVITDFTMTDTNAYSLEYQIGTDTYYTNYSWDDSGLYTYEFVDPDGNVTTETYQR